MTERVLDRGTPPVSLDLARAHLRVGDDREDDELIREKLEMAAAIAGDITGRRICEQAVEIDVLPTSGATILVPLPVPTFRIVGLFVGGMQVARRKYSLINTDFSSTLSIDSCYSGKKIRIRCITGYSEATLPSAIKAAILLLLGTLYDNEADTIVGRSVAELSLSAGKLLQPWRITPYDRGDV